MNPEVEFDLASVVVSIEKSKIMELNMENHYWTMGATKDKIYWTDMSDEETDDETNDEEFVEIPNRYAAIIVGKNQIKTAGLLVEWVLQSCGEWFENNEDLSIITYYQNELDLDEDVH